MVLLCAYRKYISPLLPSACRFYPSCSVYAYVAIGRFGAALVFLKDCCGATPVSAIRSGSRSCFGLSMQEGNISTARNRFSGIQDCLDFQTVLTSRSIILLTLFSDLPAAFDLKQKNYAPRGFSPIDAQ